MQQYCKAEKAKGSGFGWGSYMSHAQNCNLIGQIWPNAARAAGTF